PFVWITYLYWQPRVIHKLSAKVNQITVRKHGNNVLIPKSLKLIDGWGVLAIAAIVTVGFGFLQIHNDQTAQEILKQQLLHDGSPRYVYWWEKNGYYYCGWLAGVGLSYFVGSIVITRFLRLLWWFPIEFWKKRAKLIINPVHEDNAGGVSVLGNTYIFCIFVAAGFLTILGAYSFAHPGNPAQYSEITLTIILSFLALTVSLFYPIFTIGQAMSESRDNMITPIKDELDENTAVKTNHFERHWYFTQFMLIKKSYPVWPFTQAWQGLLSSVAYIVLAVPITLLSSHFL
ncbi:MAG: hypothetical protein ACYDG3_12340, partial [Bacillati bacterium]